MYNLYMCGIIGYIGKREAFPVLIKGLQRLEYRGYDSAGVAIVADGMKVFKKKGKVAELLKLAEGADTKGTIGIGHTRWATHGEPSDRNSHPHLSESGSLAIIHNGIIENYVVLKQALEKGIFSVNNPNGGLSEVEVPIRFIVASNEGIGLTTSREANGQRHGKAFSYDQQMVKWSGVHENKAALKAEILSSNGSRNQTVSGEGTPGISEELLIYYYILKLVYIFM